MSVRVETCRNNQHQLSRSRALPAKPALAKATIRKQSFTLCNLRFGISSSSLMPCFHRNSHVQLSQ
eukprot:13945117-Ditylum_brightwellii.AAC.1